MVEFVLVIVLMLAVATTALAAPAKRPPVPAGGTAFTCTVVRIWDGDGPIWCAEGPRLRLAGVNARELDNSCRPGARCVRTSGVAARDGLAALLGGAQRRSRERHVVVSPKKWRCISRGADRYKRTLANCADVNGDVGRQLVRAGLVAD